MPVPKELTEEEVFDNDIDPMDAIKAIRREQGVPEDQLPERLDDISEVEHLGQDEATDNGEDELDALNDNDEENANGEDNEQGGEQPTGEGDGEGDEGAADDSNASEGDKPLEDEANGDESGKEDLTPTSRKFRANGQDFEFTQEEINEQFESVFGKAMDYTQKMQKIAPYRKMISALEQEGVTQEALNIAIDALKGDKGALQKLMKDNDIDAYDLASESDDAPAYNPNVYGKDEKVLDIEEITRTIASDKEFRITTNVIDEQWDPRSREIIVQNPTMIQGLHNDIKTGLYDKVAPAAMKMKVLDGNTKSDIEYYMLAGEQLRLATEAQDKQNSAQAEVNKRNANTQAAEQDYDKASSEARTKRSANSTGGRADSGTGVIDFLDDDDEAFDAWYEKVMSQ
jgi:hypothetical protein